MKKVTMEGLMAYCNQYGFIFQGSEIYGGLANTRDYGPLGTRLKNNMKDVWRYYFIQKRENSFELDADNLISDYDANVNADAMTQEEMMKYIREKNVPYPKCRNSNFTDIRQFNLMFATQRGFTGDASNTVYLRPENAQGEYVNFLNVQRTMRAKLPFSIGQIGKAFRNEITPGNFTFRTIELEQMEF